MRLNREGWGIGACVRDGKSIIYRSLSLPDNMNNFYASVRPLFFLPKLTSGQKCSLIRDFRSSCFCWFYKLHSCDPRNRPEDFFSRHRPNEPRNWSFLQRKVYACEVKLYNSVSVRSFHALYYVIPSIFAAERTEMLYMHGLLGRRSFSDFSVPTQIESSVRRQNENSCSVCYAAFPPPRSFEL